MPDPSQRRLRQRQPVLLNYRLDNPESIERLVLEIPVSIRLAQRALVAVPALSGNVFGLVFA